MVNLGTRLVKFGWALVIFIRALRFRADFFLNGLELQIFKQILLFIFKECVWRFFFFKVDVEFRSDSLAAFNFDLIAYFLLSQLSSCEPKQNLNFESKNRRA
jgi:hypothetical protein